MCQETARPGQELRLQVFVGWLVGVGASGFIRRALFLGERRFQQSKVRCGVYAERLLHCGENAEEIKLLIQSGRGFDIKLLENKPSRSCRPHGIPSSFLR